MSEPTPTTTRKKLPRYDTRSRPGGETWTSPLPDRLVALMGDAPEVVRHRELARHFTAAREKAVAIAGRLEKTKADDQRRAAEALASGKPRPAARAEKIELDLRQAREDVSLLADLLRDSADELLAAAVPFVEDALAAAERDAEAAIEEVRVHLEAARAAVEESDARGGERGWLASLAKSGIVWPWSPGTRARARSRT